jgi:hypothetical protein
MYFCIEDPAHSCCGVLSDTTFRQWQQCQHSQLLCIQGHVGKSKTMLLCGIISKRQRLIHESTILYFDALDKCEGSVLDSPEVQTCTQPSCAPSRDSNEVASLD